MKITKSFMALFCAMGMLMTTHSCKEWGESDDPAGNQVYPAREPLGSISFKGLNSIDAAEFVLSSTGTAAISFDNDLYTEVLELTSGTITLANPMTNAKLQTGAGVTLWAKSDGTSNGPLVTFIDGEGGKVSFSTKGELTSTTPTKSVVLNQKTNDETKGVSEEPSNELLPADVWCFLGIQINSNGCIVYKDGEIFATASYEKDDALVSIVNNAKNVIIGDEAINHLSAEKISFIRNSMNANDVKRPNITKVVTLPDPVYFTDFSSTGGLTIVGAGEFTTDPNDKFGNIFQNKASSAPRQNYLLMPDHILSHSADTKQMTIGFWVNASNAGTSASYNWAPLFMAYTAAPVNGENTLPMLACQYRGVLQVNCAGWTDYTNEQNVAGVNTLYHNDTNMDWLQDHEWHYYTVVFDNENAKVYFDGQIANEWQMDGVANTQMGLFSNGADLKYICLGGNQAWNWGDNDPGFAFDDFVVYNEALSEEQVAKIISDKSGGGGGVIPADLPEFYYRNTFESDAELSTATIVGDGEYVTKGDNHGQVFQNVTSSAPRKNYLLLPEDLLTHSADTKQLTIGFWVNKSNAGESNDYLWAPLFMAYGAKNDPNTWPMLACQYRGVLQLNCAGWTDYSNEQNTAGVNTLYHGDTDWLADGGWHYYTVVFDNENAKVYFDGVLKNEWNMDGATNTQMGLFNNGADLKYICLGGNQAWDWGDNDAGFAYDDITCFNVALSAAQIKALMSVYQ